MRKDGDNVLRLKDLRKKKNITQREIAALINVTTSAYSDKENMRRGFKGHEVVILCEFFNVNPGDVYEFRQKIREMQIGDK